MTCPAQSVLMIDDDRELCSLLQEYCALEGLALHAAHNGEAGVLMALGSGFDLVILDVMMPGMSDLGLPIARGAAELHGGAIIARNMPGGDWAWRYACRQETPSRSGPWAIPGASPELRA